MGKIAGICENSACNLGLSGDPVEVEESNFVCPICKGKLTPMDGPGAIELGQGTAKKNPNRAAVVVSLTVLLLGGGIWGLNRWIEGDPKISLDEIGTAPLDFGLVSIGDSASRPATVKNTGTGTLQVKPVREAGAPFTCTPALLKIPPGGQATLNFNYQPEQPGEQKGVLHLTVNDRHRPTLSVEARGFGVKHGPWWLWEEWEKITTVLKPATH